MSYLAKFRVAVCWLDGHNDIFDAIDAEDEANVLSICMSEGCYRYIPLMNIRWYDVYSLHISDEYDQKKSNDDAADTTPVDERPFFCPLNPSALLTVTMKDDCAKCNSRLACKSYDTMLGELANLSPCSNSGDT